MNAMRVTFQCTSCGKHSNALYGQNLCNDCYRDNEALENLNGELNIFDDDYIGGF